jgi:formylglycine-generating enzyme required for sulfatase activity
MSKAHVFISYSRRDTAFVDKLERALQGRSIVMWRDVHSIPGGAKWFRRIKQGLEASYAMLYIDTPHAEQSDWVEKEFLFAQNLKLETIPVKDDASFMSFQTINLNPVLCDEANFEAGIGKIVARLAELPQVPIKPDAVPPPEPERREPSADSDVWAESGEQETIASMDYSAEVQQYVAWLLVQSQADLRDALYVNLSAQAEERKKPVDNPFGMGLDMDAGMSFEPLGLERIMGDAFDKAGEPVEDARVPVHAHERVILLGEPGSGKTTTLLQLAVDLARQVQDDPDNVRIPIFVPLRKYDGSITFVDFVRQQMYNLQDAYTDLIQQDKLIFLLDALNEMPRTDDDGRDLVADVRDFAQKQARWVVSCRVRDYQEELKDVPDVSKVRLQPLDPPRIRDVIMARFREQFAPQGIASESDGESLWQAMYGSDDLLTAWQNVTEKGTQQQFWGLKRPDGIGYSWESDARAWQAMANDKRRMMHLCRNPYMTKMVSDIYAIDKSLPDNRGALFKKFVDKLLARDEALAKSVGATWLDDALIRKGLAEIAYRMGAQTELPRTQAETILHDVVPQADSALLLRIAQGASLLDVGQDVRFTHQLLQEYFASEVMGALVDDGVPATTLWQPENWWEPNGREETAIILAGVRGDPEGIARWLASAQPELAVQVLQESGVPVDLATLDADTRQALIDSANAKAKSDNPVERAAAYRVLGLLNVDNRQGIGVIEVKVPSPSEAVGRGDLGVRAIRLPDIAWGDPLPANTEVPIGGDSDAYQALPAQTVQFPYAYRLSRYTITYGQFQCFVDDASEMGYEYDTWWDGFPDNYKRQPMLEQNNPYDNHPRDNVSWYQAVAFCRWLTWHLHEAGLLDSGEEIRLPSSQEWEAYARYPDGRKYVYGDSVDVSMMNVRDTGIGKTSAVGLFASSPLGVYDMNGNVWEWCLTKFKEDGEPEGDAIDESGANRVLRAGAFGSSSDNARAASRNDFGVPSLRDGGIGYRCFRSY